MKEKQKRDEIETWVIFDKNKKKGRMVGPHAMDKSLIGSEEQGAATAGEGNDAQGKSTKHRGLVTRRTARAVVNRPFKQCQVHYREVTFVREMPWRS
jgi:hypothetical protein